MNYMSLVNHVQAAGHHETLVKWLHLMFYSYTEKTAESDPKPFAVAINVPRNQCQGNFDSSNFLIHENATRVKNYIYKENNKFYNGNKSLIAAGRLTGVKSQNCESKPVSYLLQRNAAFAKLLERGNDSCVVIYTVYSPCQNTSANIIPTLETLKNHSGIKAFVFSLGVDENDHECSDLALNCTEIVKYVPLYRFVNKAVIPI